MVVYMLVCILGIEINVDHAYLIQIILYNQISYSNIMYTYNIINNYNVS